MDKLKKSLSVFLTLVMLFTTLCFFVLPEGSIKANAAADNVVICVPETIYMTPSTGASKEGSLYVNNTVDASGNVTLDKENNATSGKISIYAPDAKSATFKVVAAKGGKTGEPTVTKEGEILSLSNSHYSASGFNLESIATGITAGNSDIIRWEFTITFKDDTTATYTAYSALYSPYLAPVGAAMRVKAQASSDVFSQSIAWISGVHSINESSRSTADEDKYDYQRVRPNYLLTSSGKGMLGFLSTKNSAVANNSTAVSGISGAAGDMYAVFASTTAANSYFYAGQSGSDISGNGAMDWFEGSSTFGIYSFDWYSTDLNPSSDHLSGLIYSNASGKITIDSSRYKNLNQIPNLGVGFMVTDNDGGSTASWYVADFSDSYTLGKVTDYFQGNSNDSTRYFPEHGTILGSQLSDASNYDSSLSSSYTGTGLKYAGSWNRALKDGTTVTYSVKTYHGSKNKNSTNALGYTFTDLIATQIDKGTLRSTLRTALANQAKYGVKDGFGSYLYDTTNSAWTDYVNAYEAAYKALGNPTATASEVSSANTALENAMKVLDKNAARKVFFNVNYDDINPNLYVLGSAGKTEGGVTATVNTANESVIFSGMTTGNGYYINTPFTPEEGAYTFSSTQVSGSRSGDGCIVLESYTDDYKQLNGITGVESDRRKLDMTGSASALIEYTDQLAKLTDLAYVWVWHNGAANATAGVYNNLEMKFKIEKGGTKTAYSPAARISDSDGTYPTLPVLSRQGYDFLGWYTDASLTTKVDENTKVTSDTLYAKWGLAQFKVSFDTILDLATWDISGVDAATPIGNTGISLTNKNTTGEYTLESPSFPVTAGKEYYINVDATTDAGAGHHWDVYIFFYNANNPNTPGIDFSDGNQHFEDGSGGNKTRTFKAPAGATYARIRLDSNTSGVTVNFDNIRVIEKGRAVSGASYVPAQTVTYTMPYGTLPTPTREGYTFVGWNDADGNRVTSATVHNILGNTVLYSEWNVLKYDLVWEDGSGNIIERVEEVPYGTEITPPANDPTRTAYTFGGWYKDVNDEATEFKAGTTMSVGGLTYKAKWIPVTYTVSYNLDGGTLGGNQSQTYNIESGVTLLTGVPTKSGYTFGGWTVEATNGDWAALGTLTAGQKVENKYGNVTLKAIWNTNDYTVTYDTDGGSIIGSSSVGYKISDTVTIPVPVKTGYNFLRWDVSGTDHNWAASYNGGEQLTDRYGDVTLKAIWEKKTYTVTFKNPEDVNFADVEIGVKFEEAPSYSGETPKKAETAQYTYEFIGWKNTATGNVISKDELGSEKITADTTYTAVFEDVAKTFTVTFTYNVSATEQNTIEVTDVAYNTLVSDIIPAAYTKGYPGTTDKFTHTHYIARTNIAAGTRVTDDMSFTATYTLSGNLTLTEEAPDHNPPTCTEGGKVSMMCSGCGYTYSEDQEALGHTEDNGIVTLQPTCLENGVMTYKCSRCEQWRTEEMNALGHNFSDNSAKTATCAERGWEAHRECVRCKNVFPADATEASPVDPEYNPYITVGHTVDDNAPATCNAPQRCTVCNQVVNPQLEHIRIETFEYSAGVTCTNAGTYYIITTCERGCDLNERTQMNGTKPHSFEFVEAVGAYCTTEGYHLYACTTCPAENPAEERRNVVPALGHNPGPWEIIKDSTCTDAGSRQQSCLRCEQVIATEALELANHKLEWVTITAADCENQGSKKYACTECPFIDVTETISSLGHIYGERATCEEACVCEREGCGKELEPKLGHSWDNGVIEKEPTETEEGLRVYTCFRDAAHTKEEIIPIRVVIEVLPGVSTDAALVIKAGEDGFAGNINDLVRVEEGVPYSVIVDNPGVITINANGEMIAVGDGDTIITVITNDGKYKKSFAVTVKLLKTITFDVNGVLTKLKAYAGDAFEAIEVEPYIDENGFPRTFTHWTINGVVASEFICTGDMYFTAQFTSSCKYGEFDAVAAKFRDVLNAGNNAELIADNQAKVDAALALIAEFTADRDKRTSDKQYLIDAAVSQISATIISIYPDKNTDITIRGAAECTAGTYVDITAYLMPVDVPVDDCVWTTTDRTIGFFSEGRFYAVKPGTVTLKASRGTYTAEHTITVNSTVGGRVIFFDTLLSNARYIVEGAYIVEQTTNIFWSPYEDVHFRVATDHSYDEYGVYVNSVRVYPAADGTYTIPANTGDAHIRMVGFDNEDTGDGEGGNDNSTVEKLSFWDMIRNFFKKIGDFFRNLFGG